MKGPWVTQSYFNRNEASRLAKIKDHGNALWHRMGDVGFLMTKTDYGFVEEKINAFAQPTEHYSPSNAKESSTFILR